MSLAPPPSHSTATTPSTTPPPPNGAKVHPTMKTAKSHQSGTIDHHWNDLPQNFLPTSSRSVSPNPATIDNSSSPSSSSSSSSSLGEDFAELLTQLFSDATPTTLAAREKKMCHDRVLKAAPGLSDTQKSEVGGVLRKMLSREETPQWGRERIVEFMMRERGVAGWAAALRRGVECIKWD